MSVNFDLEGPDPVTYEPVVTRGGLFAFLGAAAVEDAIINHMGGAPFVPHGFAEGDFGRGFVQCKSGSKYFDTPILDQPIEVFIVAQTDETALGSTATRPILFGSLASTITNNVLADGGKAILNSTSAPYPLLVHGSQANGATRVNTSVVVPTPLDNIYNWKNFSLLEARFTPEMIYGKDHTRSTPELVLESFAVPAFPYVTTGRYLRIGSGYNAYGGRNKIAACFGYEPGITDLERLLIKADLQQQVFERGSIVV